MTFVSEHVQNSFSVGLAPMILPLNQCQNKLDRPHIASQVVKCARWPSIFEGVHYLHNWNVYCLCAVYPMFFFSCRWTVNNACSLGILHVQKCVMYLTESIEPGRAISVTVEIRLKYYGAPFTQHSLTGRLVIRNSFLYPRLKLLWSHHLFDSHTVGLWEFPVGFPVINVSLLWNLWNLMCLRPGCTPELHSLHCKYMYIPTGVLEGKDKIWSWDISRLLFRFQSLKVTVVSVSGLCNSVGDIERLTCLALCKWNRTWLRLSNHTDEKSSLCPMTAISAYVVKYYFHKLHIKRAQSSQSLGIPVCPLLAVNETSKQW